MLRKQIFLGQTEAVAVGLRYCRAKGFGPPPAELTIRQVFVPATPLRIPCSSIDGILELSHPIIPLLDVPALFEASYDVHDTGRFDILSLEKHNWQFEIHT
jgi:hypothetical protein